LTILVFAGRNIRNRPNAVYQVLNNYISFYHDLLENMLAMGKAYERRVRPAHRSGARRAKKGPVKLWGSP